MDETPNQEFFEVTNSSEEEYFDAICPDNSHNSVNYWYDEIKPLNILKHCYSKDEENTSVTLKNKISGLIDPSKLTVDYMLSDNKEAKKIEITKSIKDETEEPSEILEAILNEDTLKKIYFEEKCLLNDIETSNKDDGIENKINLWNYINNSYQNRTSLIDSREDGSLNSIEKEVEELELEIEKMFNSRSSNKFNTEPISSFNKNSFGEDSNEKTDFQIQNEEKISHSSLCTTAFETSLKNQTPEKEEYVSQYDGINNKKSSFHEIHSSGRVPGCERKFTKKLSSETESWNEHEDSTTVFQNDSSEAFPIHSVEIIPKLIEIQRYNPIEKIDEVKNSVESNGLIKCNICTPKPVPTDNYSKKLSKAKMPQEFKKARSFFVSSEGSKKTNKKNSYSFHSGSYTNMKEKKLKRDSKKRKIEIPDVQEPEENCKAVNTRRIKKMSYSSRNNDQNNFCSISLVLESANSNMAMNDLLKSLKEYFWLTESIMERALLQLVILFMSNDLPEILIKNGKFKLFCRKKSSTGSSLKTDVICEQNKINKNYFKSDLICQPLFIETITSESQVNRLGLKNLNSNKFQTPRKRSETKDGSFPQENKLKRKRNKMRINNFNDFII